MNDSLTDEQLAEIAARCEAASTGPWISYVEGRDHVAGSDMIKIGPKKGKFRDEIEIFGGSIADKDFVAHARQDIPRLLEEIRRLKAALAR